jgi:hypothetical protein
MAPLERLLPIPIAGVEPQFMILDPGLAMVVGLVLGLVFCALFMAR